MSTPSKDNLFEAQKAMAAAAFMGVALYLCLELNARLIFISTRRTSLYFWSCLICSWSIMFHTVALLLYNYAIWAGYSATVLVHFSWWVFVTLQSVVLYSRLNLIMKNDSARRYVLYMIIFVSMGFGFTTFILSLLARHKDFYNKPALQATYIIWEQVQITVFFVEETIISLLYIHQTASHLKNMTLLGKDKQTTRKAMRHLIYINIYIIALDISLLALCYSKLFLLQGFYRAAVYTVKLRTEFTILNQLRACLSGNGSSDNEYKPHVEHGRPASVALSAMTIPEVGPEGSQDDDIEKDDEGEIVETFNLGGIWKTTTTTTVSNTPNGSRHVMVRNVS